MKKLSIYPKSNQIVQVLNQNNQVQLRLTLFYFPTLLMQLEDFQCKFSRWKFKRNFFHFEIENSFVHNFI
ncbi:hypothetical protein T10_2065 [Trichinella papuae]|uniref:Uncharacterized protein n=1 Tax=Trichinella papuae TaxID=268474 RepID=A0A0V1N2F4_9BILA|nr:hypothetical protein T10_2065 [Trichinella papuae]